MEVLEEQNAAANNTFRLRTNTLICILVIKVIYYKLSGQNIKELCYNGFYKCEGKILFKNGRLFIHIFYES